MRATRPAYVLPFDYIILIMFVEEYKYKSTSTGTSQKRYDFSWVSLLPCVVLQNFHSVLEF
jgi:hypothetical protein